MKKIILIAFAFIWVLSLIILIIALTDLVPNTIFKDYRFIIGIGFLVVSRFLSIAYQKLVEPE